jgi:hypothetical protein
MGPGFLQDARPRCGQLRTAGAPWRGGTSPASYIRDNPEAVTSGQISALPAEIANRSHRLRRTSPAPGILRHAGHLYLCRRWSRPLLAMSQTPRPYWSRPMRADVCSMFARMPRYAPAPSGIRSAARMRATGQNGSSRHVLALFDSSSKRINEQSSGLLIRGFGVQVPGGAPGLTWGFRLQVVLLSELVGPWWVQCGTSFGLCGPGRCLTPGFRFLGDRLRTRFR